MMDNDLNNEWIEKNNLLLRHLEKRLGKVYTPAKNLTEAYESVNERMELFKMQRDVIEVANKIRRASSLSQMGDPFERLSNQNRLQEGIAAAVLKFAQFGWYVNYLHSPVDIMEAYKLFREDESKFDNLLAETIRGQIETIKGILYKRHNHRIEPLRAAFRAHELKEYYLSIPVFFTQADGISKDLSQYQFFLNNSDFLPKVSKWAKQNPKIWIHIALCAALLEKGAFQKHHSQPNKIRVTRRSIMHGESTDYGTEINSLKSISLLIYLSDVMSPLDIHHI